MKDKVEIARRYRKRKHYKKSVQQLSVPFPAPETMKQELAQHLRATGQMFYDKFNDYFWGIYHGVKIIQDHLNNCKAFYVADVSEKYHEATESELYAAYHYK